MKAIVIFVLLAYSGLAARVEPVTLDLERPQQPFALTATERTDVTITATLRASGSEFDPAGWTGLLWYGTQDGGVTLTNTSASVGSMTWNVPVAAMPTNGRYIVQIIGTASNLVEDWGRGSLSVRLNPSASTLPADWRYGDAAYIAATNAERKLNSHVVSTNNPHNVTASQIGALTSESDPVAGPRLALLEGKTNNWDAAYGWGNHALAGYLGAATWINWLGTNTYVKTETDPAALSALTHYAATNRVTRWYESQTNWMEFAGGDKVLNYQVTADHFWHLEFTTAPLPLPYPLVAGTYGEWRVLDYDYGTYYVEWNRDGYGSAASGVPGLETEFSIPLSDGMTNVFYSPVVVTNVFVRYLGSAPPLTAETWSYADMTNWLAAGNAGESWVLDISSYSAQAAVNNHAATPGLHLIDGDRAKIDGAINAAVTSNIVLAVKEFHADSYTNLIWRTVWSNGWCYAVAFTNVP